MHRVYTPNCWHYQYRRVEFGMKCTSWAVPHSAGPPNKLTALYSKVIHVTFKVVPVRISMHCTPLDISQTDHFPWLQICVVPLVHWHQPLMYCPTTDQSEVWNPRNSIYQNIAHCQKWLSLQCPLVSNQCLASESTTSLWMTWVGKCCRTLQ